MNNMDAGDINDYSEWEHVPLPRQTWHLYLCAKTQGRRLDDVERKLARHDKLIFLLMVAVAGGIGSAKYWLPLLGA